MANSPEYPDLAWRPPKSFSPGRPAGPPRWIVIHTTEGSEGPRSAEDGAAYDARRTDGTSAHYFHDQDSTVQCVRTTDRAHTARATGNARGIHHELCGRAAQDLVLWDDEASAGTLARAARQAARDARKHNIPVRKLSVAQVRAGARGFCGHADISAAFGESDHSDPGPAFPWSRFLRMVRTHIDEEEDDVALTDADIDKIAARAAEKVWGTTYASTSTAARWPDGGGRKSALIWLVLAAIHAHDAAKGSDDVDEQAIIAGVVAGLSSDQLEDILRQGMTPEARLALAARLAA